MPANRLGEAVWVWNAAWGRPFGTATQWVALPADQAVALPAQVSLEVGACLGIPALTAYHAVAVNGGVAGKRVLIAGGAGAVGHYALQCARQMGASQIITTVSSAEKAAVASAAGADLVVNYKSENVTDRIRQATAGQGVDRIIEVDIAANMLTDLAVTTPTGEIIVYGSGQPNVSIPFYPAILNNVTLHFFMVYRLSPADRMRAIAALTAMLAANTLQHQIAARLPLERIAEAHELVETGQANGNVILDVGH